MALTPVQRQAITTILTDFLKDTRGRMRKINVPEIHINPFLMRLWARSTGLDSSGQIAKWMVAQRLERGNVTAFGLTLKKVAQVFSDESVAEVDVTKRWEGKTYHVHVTSGPSAMAKPAADSHVKEIKAIAAKHGAEPRVGVCYGDDAAISTVMKRTIEEEGGVPILSGQRFWEFVSGDAACAQTIFEICGRVGDAQASAAGKSTSASPEYQMERILEEFESQYGVKDFWAELFKKNS